MLDILLISASNVLEKLFPAEVEFHFQVMTLL